METRSETRLPESRRLETLAGQTLVDIRKLNARAEQLLRCLRGEENSPRRDRVSPADDEAGWRLAA